VRYEITLTLEEIDTLRSGDPITKAVRGGVIKIVPDLDLEAEKFERVKSVRDIE